MSANGSKARDLKILLPPIAGQGIGPSVDELFRIADAALEPSCMVPRPAVEMPIHACPFRSTY